MKLGLVVLAALLAAAVAASTSSARPAIQAPPVAFTDAAGDAGTAPDITGCSVTNDDHGLYTFTVSFAAPYDGDVGALLYLDTDKNASTGNLNDLGAEYMYVDDYSVHEYGLYHWSGVDWTLTSSTTTSVVVASDRKSVTFTVNKSELDNATAFDFWFGTYEGEGTEGHYDMSPDGLDAWAYTLQTVFTLSAGASQNSNVKAGGTWTVGLTALRSDTAASVGTDATIACSASAGTKRLKLVNRSFVSSGGGAGNVADCSFAVPKTTKKGTSLRASITVSLGGQSITQAFVRKLK